MRLYILTLTESPTKMFAELDADFDIVHRQEAEGNALMIDFCMTFSQADDYTREDVLRFGIE